MKKALALILVVLMLVAAVGLLTGAFNRRGHGARVTMTVLSMALLQIVILAVENLAMKNLAFVPLIYFLAFLPVVVCVVLLRYAGFLNVYWKKIVAAGGAVLRFVFKERKRAR